MDLKKEFIISTLKYLKSISKSYVIKVPDDKLSVSNTKALLNIFNKEFDSKKNIFIISSQKAFFDNLFVGKVLKKDTSYNLGKHSITLKDFNKNLLSENLDVVDIVILNLYDDLKLKDLSKLMKNIPNCKKIIFFAKKFDKASAPTSIASIGIDEFSFVPSQSTSYYSYMKSKLGGIK